MHSEPGLFRFSYFTPGFRYISGGFPLHDYAIADGIAAILERTSKGPAARLCAPNSDR